MSDPNGSYILIGEPVRLTRRFRRRIMVRFALSFPAAVACFFGLAALTRLFAVACLPRNIADHELFGCLALFLVTVSVMVAWLCVYPTALGRRKVHSWFRTMLEDGQRRQLPCFMVRVGLEPVVRKGWFSAVEFGDDVGALLFEDEGLRFEGDSIRFWVRWEDVDPRETGADPFDGATVRFRCPVGGREAFRTSIYADRMGAAGQARQALIATLAARVQRWRACRARLAPAETTWFFFGLPWRYTSRFCSRTQERATRLLCPTRRKARTEIYGELRSWFAALAEDCRKRSVPHFVVGVEFDPRAVRWSQRPIGMDDVGLLIFDTDALQYRGDSIDFIVPYKHVLYIAERPIGNRGGFRALSGYYLKLLTPVSGKGCVIFALLEGETPAAQQTREAELRKLLAPFWVEAR